MYNFIHNQRGKVSFKAMIISLVVLSIVSSSGFYLFRWAEGKGDLGESGEFLAKVKSKPTVAGSQALSFKVDLGQAGLDIDQVLDEAEIKIIDSSDRQMNDNFKVRMAAVEGGEYEFRIEPKNKNAFRPGRYHVEARFETPAGVRDYSQDFYWGVLAMNTNKSVYLPGEQAFLQFAVLDDRGDTLCDGKLSLKVQAPSTKVQIFSTEDRTIIRNPECGPNNVIDTPDYYAYYNLDGVGVYKFELTAETINGTRTLLDYVEVKESLPFEVERIGPTRIYPKADYEIKLKIKVNQDFRGLIREYMPDYFKVVDESSQSQIIGQQRVINWQVDWQAGEIHELNYTFDAPNISPEFYLLGPLEFYE